MKKNSETGQPNSTLDQSTQETIDAQSQSGADKPQIVHFQTQSDRDAQLRAAFHRLDWALQVSEAYDPQQPDHGRDYARLMLISISELLSVLLPNRPTLPVVLQDLLQGLVDLDKGTVIPLLTPADLRGRPPTPLGEQLLRALAAAAMTRLMAEPGVSREQASQDIARRLNRLGFGPDKASGVQVAKWRETLMAAFVREDLAAQRYHLALTCVKDMAPEQAVGFLIGSLHTLNLGAFPKKPVV